MKSTAANLLITIVIVFLIGLGIRGLNSTDNKAPHTTALHHQNASITIEDDSLRKVVERGEAVIRAIRGETSNDLAQTRETPTNEAPQKHEPLVETFEEEEEIATTDTNTKNEKEKEAEEENPKVAESSTEVKAFKENERKAVNKGPFLVIAGAFSVKENAEKAKNKLQKLGYSQTQLIQFEEKAYQSVCVNRFSVKNEALNLVNQLEDKGIKAYVHRQKQ